MSRPSVVVALLLALVAAGCGGGEPAQPAPDDGGMARPAALPDEVQHPDDGNGSLRRWVSAADLACSTYEEQLQEVLERLERDSGYLRPFAQALGGAIYVFRDVYRELDSLPSPRDGVPVERYMRSLRIALKGMDRARRAAAAEDEAAMAPGIRMLRRAGFARHAARLGLVSCPGAA